MYLSWIDPCAPIKHLPIFSGSSQKGAQVGQPKVPSDRARGLSLPSYFLFFWGPLLSCLQATRTPYYSYSYGLSSQDSRIQEEVERMACTPSLSLLSFIQQISFWWSCPRVTMLVTRVAPSTSWKQFLQLPCLSFNYMYL